MEWTEKQKQIIDFAGGHLLVSASAGSGKTTVMLGRVMRLIADGYSLKNMLISTFTVSAADDMRTKLAKNLTAAYAATGEKRYADELEYLPSADICTLHKWCQKLIRRYFYVTGDDPAFEIAEEGECAGWRNEAIDAAIDEAVSDPRSDYGAVAHLYIKKRSDSNIRRIVREIMIFADSQPDADAWIAGGAAHYADSASCRAYLAAVADGKYKMICAQADALELNANALGLVKAKPLIDEVRANLCGAGVPYSRAAGITEIKDEFDALKKRAAAYSAFVDKIAAADNTAAGRAAKVFLALATRARALYAAKKTEKGKLDFTDLERKAKEILASEDGELVRASLTHVFIDEYQDINPLQESIINLLGDNLFFVGDIKQSIYAFRNCSPAAFASKRDELAGRGLVELNRNYRSKPGILRFANAVFSRVMTADFGRVDYAESARFAVEKGDGDDGSVEILLTEPPERSRETVDFNEVYSVRDHIGKNRTGSAETEADAVTEKIVDLLSGDSTYTYGDIAVLVRSRNGAADVIARNLRALGIPVSVSTKSGVSGGRCNKLLLSYLRLVDNFRDDVSLVAVMRSVIGGFGDAELAALRAAYPDEEYFFSCVTRAAAAGDAKTSAFLADVARYTELAGVLTVGELAGRITSDKKLFGTVLSESLGIAKADGLGRLLANMSAFNGTLSEYLAYVAENDPAIDTPPQPGSVRIMTVHASKGLEFPVVLMCGLHAPFRTDTAAGELCDGEFGLGLESRVAETGETLPSLPLLAVRERKKRAELEEEMRILYVALTRARDKLVLFLRDGAANNKMPEEANCYADWLYPSAVAHGMKKAEKVDDAAEKAPESLPPLREAALAALREQIEFDPALPVRDLKKSVTSLLAERDFAADAEETDDLAVCPPALFGAEYDGRDAMERGTAFHAALEQMDFFAPFDGQTVTAAGEFAAEDLAKLRAAHASIGGLFRGWELFREQPFLCVADGNVGGESGVILQGVIDLLAVRGDEAAIVDYKTGFLTAERRAKYDAQLAIYAYAVECLLGMKVTQKRVYLIDACRFAD